MLGLQTFCSEFSEPLLLSCLRAAFSCRGFSFQPHVISFIMLGHAGFVVCAYLILACGLTVDDALSSFGTARPPGVRHEKFVDELRRRYDTKGVEPADPSRSSMGSLRSDMATVAEFLDAGPGLEALGDQALDRWGLFLMQ